MDLLEEYFLGAYLEEKRETKNINNLLFEIWPLFCDFHNKNGWPYEIEDDKKVEFQREISFSTCSNILFVVALALGRLRQTVLLPSIKSHMPLEEREDLAKLRPEFERVFQNEFRHIIVSSQKKFRKDDQIFDSQSFGDNDPFTLTWFLELLISVDRYDSKLKARIEHFDDFKDKLTNCAVRVVRKAFEEPQEPFLAWRTTKRTQKTPVDHAFPLLRTIHLYRVLSGIKDSAPIKGKLTKIEEFMRERLRLHLLSRVHQHLSFYNITDSMFDAAELVFYIEGVLLIERMLSERKNVPSGGGKTFADLRVLDRNLLDRAFNVIDESQKRSPYWRPLKPFVRTPQGLALLPLSVEIANSLLRICKYLEPFDEATTYFSKHVDLFKRYAGWLYTRVARGDAFVDRRRCSFSGWHSEHVHVPRKIHPWETSQVILFLMQYQAMLQEHVARTALKRANLSSDFKERKQEKLSYSEYWEKHCEPKEPLFGLPDNSSYRVFSKIRAHYLLPRGTDSHSKEDVNPHYSMLLYGPPGTGKNSIAEELAKALTWPLITVAPSDFIARGESEVEARAKAIFQTLEEQSKVIILFDEIDQLILDRDSQFYRGQSDIFKFMTPGMLVKMKRLRETKGPIFIIATNYEERVDTAVKRVGRIDDRFLILPPDKKQRFEIIKREIKKELGNLPASTRTRFKIKLTERRFESILQRTVLYTHGEIEQLVSDGVSKFVKSGRRKTIDTLLEILEDIWAEHLKPSVRLASYENRFKNYSKKASAKEKHEGDLHSPSVQEPFEEFFLLVYLKSEADSLDDTEINLLQRVLKRIADDLDVDSMKKDKAAKERVYNEIAQRVRDKDVAAAILKAFLKRGH